MFDLQHTIFELVYRSRFVLDGVIMLLKGMIMHVSYDDVQVGRCSLLILDHSSVKMLF